MKKMIVQAGLAALLLPGLAHADIFEKVGTFGGQFLKISVGARGAGMGGAFVAVADDATSVFWNAAGIARMDVDKSQLSLNHANWPAELSFDQVGYVGTRSIRQALTSFELNPGVIVGAGINGRPLSQKFGIRTSRSAFLPVRLVGPPLHQHG